MTEVNLKVAMACEVSTVYCVIGQVVIQAVRSRHQVPPSSFARIFHRHRYGAMQGCSGAVQRVLSKMPGVNSVNIDMKQQKVVVNVDPSVDPNAVKETVAKTGKKTEFWS